MICILRRVINVSKTETTSRLDYLWRKVGLEGRGKKGTKDIL